MHENLTIFFSPKLYISIPKKIFFNLVHEEIKITWKNVSCDLLLMLETTKAKF